MTNEYENEMRAAYQEYWVERDLIKKAQKQELEDRLADKRQKLAAVIRVARLHNMTVDEVCEILGTTNRNFIYTVLNDQPATRTGSGKPVGRPAKVRGDAPKIVKTDTVVSTPRLDFAWKKMDDGTVDVSIGGKDYTVEVGPFGTIVKLPEDWYAYEMPEEDKPVYRRLIAEIEGREV